MYDTHHRSQGVRGSDHHGYQINDHHSNRIKDSNPTAMAFSKVSQSSYKHKAEKKNKKKVTKMLLWKLVWGKKIPMLLWMIRNPVKNKLRNSLRYHFSNLSIVLSQINYSPSFNIIQFKLLSHHKLNQFIFQNWIVIVLTQIYNLHTVQTAITPPHTLI